MSFVCELSRYIRVGEIEWLISNLPQEDGEELFYVEYFNNVSNTTTIRFRYQEDLLLFKLKFSR